MNVWFSIPDTSNTTNTSKSLHLATSFSQTRSIMSSGSACVVLNVHQDTQSFYCIFITIQKSLIPEDPQSQNPKPAAVEKAIRSFSHLVRFTFGETQRMPPTHSVSCQLLTVNGGQRRLWESLRESATWLHNDQGI